MPSEETRTVCDHRISFGPKPITFACELPLHHEIELEGPVAHHDPGGTDWIWMVVDD